MVTTNYKENSICIPIIKQNPVKNFSFKDTANMESGANIYIWKYQINQNIEIMLVKYIRTNNFIFLQLKYVQIRLKDSNLWENTLKLKILILE